MRRQPSFLRAIFEQNRAAELTARTELQNRIAAGPPVGSGISTDAWQTWNEYGWLVCPRTKRTCSDVQCSLGSCCQAMRAFGLAGDGSQLACARRLACGAWNRQGNPCGNRVVPGKRRCRFHGGLSTGPRTEEGRARIAAAQKRRWARSTGEGSEVPALGRMPTASHPVIIDRYREADEEMAPPDSFLTI